MQRPRLRRQQLAFFLKPGVRTPELGGEEETAEGLGAAAVEVEMRIWSIRLGAARQRWLFCAYM